MADSSQDFSNIQDRPLFIDNFMITPLRIWIRSGEFFVLLKILSIYKSRRWKYDDIYLSSLCICWNMHSHPFTNLLMNFIFRMFWFMIILFFWIHHAISFDLLAFWPRLPIWRWLLPPPSPWFTSTYESEFDINFKLCGIYIIDIWNCNESRYSNPYPCVQSWLTSRLFYDIQADIPARKKESKLSLS